MARNIVHTIKLELAGGAATPQPPIGAILGSKGVSAPQFCKQFNDATQNSKGQRFGVTVLVYDDRSFTFNIGAPAAATLIKGALKLDKGSSQPNRAKVATITHAQLQAIARQKMDNTNAHTEEAVIRMLVGTARSMGVLVQS